VSRRFVISFFLIFSLLLQNLNLLISPVFASTERFTNTGFETDLSGWVTGDTDWWLSGGISSSNVVAAYQAKGASSYLVSKVNRANQEVHSLSDGTQFPDWSIVDGWTFDSTNSEFLVSDINSSVIGRGTGTIMVKYSDISKYGYNTLIGGGHWEDPYESEIVVYVINLYPGAHKILMACHGFDYSGGSPYATYLSDDIFSGVIAMAGTNLYFNGSDILLDCYGWMNECNVDTLDMYIGVENYDGFTGYSSGKIQAIVLYNTAISSSQVSAVTDAMNNLVDDSAYRDTGTKYQGSASTKVIATSNFHFTQSVNVGDTSTYNLTAYVYTDDSAVTSSDADLYSNGSTITTTYTAVGSGWYKLSGTVTGANESRDYGVQIKAGKTVYLDDLSLSLATSTATNSTTTSSSNSFSPSAPGCSDQKPSNTPNLFQIDTTSNSAKLFFAPVSGSVDKYFVSYGLTDKAEGFGIEFDPPYNNGVLSYTINSLLPNTTYYFKVRAGNGCMPGDWGNTLGAKTKSKQQAIDNNQQDENSKKLKEKKNQMEKRDKKENLKQDNPKTMKPTIKPQQENILQESFFQKIIDWFWGMWGR